MPVYLPFPLLLLGFAPFFLVYVLARERGYVLNCRRISIGIFSITFYDVSYNHKKVYSVSAPQASIQFHIPRPSDTKVISLTVLNYEYKDQQHHISIANVDVGILLLPTAPETCVGVTLDDFRVRVYHSAGTPQWMQQTRENLVSTWLNGEYLRLDDLVTKLTLCTNTGQTPTVVVPAVNGDGTEVEGIGYIQQRVAESGDSDTEPSPDQADESVLSAFASGWYITNVRTRLYSFGSVHAQLRHSWDPAEDRGTFVFIMQDCTWGLCPDDIGVAVGGKARPGAPSVTPPERQAQKPPSNSFPRLADLFKGPFRFFKFAVKLYRDPFNVVTLHSPRVDVTFDRFRLRDAELVRQGIIAARRQYTRFQHSDYSLDFAGFFQDMILDGIFGSR